VVENIATLRRRGVHVLEPGSGRLAGGDQGSGRLPDPVDIVAAADRILRASAELVGVHAVVTAGGTREPIDPVRFIGNRSSGKQGYAIAAALVRRGATVTLISTVSPPLPAPPGAEVIAVETAAEMEAAVRAHEDGAQVIVMAAAVADFAPKAVADHKLKKSDGIPDIVLEPTADILAGLGARRRPGQLLVGFAAETVPAGRPLRDYALAKLTQKGADLIVANDVSAPGAGFSHDTNAVVIVGSGGFEAEVPLSAKDTVAEAVVDAIVDQRRHIPTDHQEPT
jgi:phosphopantothenoylcysteine decarboxylase/phosphopantothenate--cysteine ligase